MEFPIERVAPVTTGTCLAGWVFPDQDLHAGLLVDAQHRSTLRIFDGSVAQLFQSANASDSFTFAAAATTSVYVYFPNPESRIPNLL